MVSKEVGGRTGLKCFTLGEFIREYCVLLEHYYDEDFGSEFLEEVLTEKVFSSTSSKKTSILCLVDTRDVTLSCSKKQALRRGGVSRRRKIKHRYSYENPFNRIHGYMIVENANNSLTPTGKDLLSLSLVCSSVFSEKRGIGSDLMDILIAYTKKCSFTDIVLEVANEYSGKGFDSDEEDSDEEDSDSDEEEEDSDEEEELEEEWSPCEDVLEIISHELWRKTMRKNESNTPYYNVDEGYILSHVDDYFFNDNFEKEEKEENAVESGEPKDYEYGGYWFKKGYESQIRLIDFYKKFGFYDEPKVNIEWNCFGEVPFPAMICHMT